MLLYKDNLQPRLTINSRKMMYNNNNLTKNAYPNKYNKWKRVSIGTFVSHSLKFDNEQKKNFNRNIKCIPLYCSSFYDRPAIRHPMNPNTYEWGMGRMFVQCR